MKPVRMISATMACFAAAASAAFAASPMSGMGDEHSRFAGPVYSGAPALSVTASLVKAGGGPKHFSTAKALTSMVGGKLVTAEVGKLSGEYGKAKVASWIKVFDFAVADSLKIATKAGVKLPQGDLSGKDLAATLVKAGTDDDGAFQIEFLLDKAVTHPIHVQVMKDIDKKFSPTADANYHEISNQAFYDLAQALGAGSVKLSAFH